MLYHKVPLLFPLCLWAGGVLCAELDFSVVWLWGCYGCGGLFFVFSATRRFSFLFLFPCLFLCGAYVSKPTPLCLPSCPVELSCRYEKGLSSHSHLASVDGCYFCFESSQVFVPGDSLRFTARLSRLPRRFRSGVFDFYRFLERRDVHVRAQVVDSVLLVGRSGRPCYYFSDVRRRLVQKAEGVFRDSLAFSMICALCLGDKMGLSSETRSLFAETGTMHLLAVSGLHTGAVWLLLTCFFRFAVFSGRRMQVFLLPVLWAYACVTGLSPSVVRAAHILTFLTLSRVFNRDYSALNSIAASALVALVFNPYALFSVSMQLSYAAYTGVVCVYPVLKRVFSVLGKLALPVGVSVSAQVATLPLCVYYFHAVSLNSFLVNLVAVPLCTLLLYGGALCLLLPDFVGGCCSVLIEGLCGFLVYVLGVFNCINLQVRCLYPSVAHVLLWYGWMVLFFVYVLRRSKVFLSLAVVCLFVLCVYSCLYDCCLRRRCEVVVFHRYAHSEIFLQDKGYGVVLRSSLSPTPSPLLCSYARLNRVQLLDGGMGFIHPDMSFCEGCLACEAGRFYVIDSLSSVRPEGGVWIVTRNVYPDSFLRLSDCVPELVVVDGSNRYYCRQAWRRVCEQLGVAVRFTEEEGDVHLPVSLKKK
ncbi:ComEC/Rec2 family competence protein [Odoribacter lunatus]|uniref:ComEC/Rec2 family competence protein n=1 Tax=Odoribacter lunatus TaxID=2941335 RepID=UPI00203FE35F|nr:ComEC/Rec2 family competence protein [Odoribacter lunatus]